MKGGQEQAVALAGNSVALESVALEVTGAAFNFLVNWSSKTLTVTDAKFTANGNTGDAVYTAIWEKAPEPTEPTEPAEPTGPAEPTETTKPGTSSPAQEAQPDAQIPQTGGQTAAWFPLLAAAGVFAAGACVGRRRRGR